MGFFEAGQIIGRRFVQVFIILLTFFIIRGIIKSTKIKKCQKQGGYSFEKTNN